MPPVIFVPPALRNIFGNYNSLKWINARKSDPNVSQFQIALPRALANFVGKLETTYRTSKFGSQLANKLANFDLKFATSPAQKYSKLAKSVTQSWRICQNWKVLSVLLQINLILIQ